MREPPGTCPSDTAPLFTNHLVLIGLRLKVSGRRTEGEGWGSGGVEEGEGFAALEAGRRLSPNLERFLVSIQPAFQDLCFGPRPGPEWATLKFNGEGLGGFGGVDGAGWGGGGGIWETQNVSHSASESTGRNARRTPKKHNLPPELIEMVIACVEG